MNSIRKCLILLSDHSKNVQFFVPRPNSWSNPCLTQKQTQNLSQPWRHESVSFIPFFFVRLSRPPHSIPQSYSLVVRVIVKKSHSYHYSQYYDFLLLLHTQQYPFSQRRFSFSVCDENISLSWLAKTYDSFLKIRTAFF